MLNLHIMKLKLNIGGNIVHQNLFLKTYIFKVLDYESLIMYDRLLVSI
jgi:hypothetical protein